MEEAGLPSPRGSLERALSDSELNFDLMEELLSGDCWLKPSNFSDFLQPSTSTSTSPFNPSPLFSLFDVDNPSPSPIPLESNNRQVEERSLPSNETVVGSELGWILSKNPTVPLKDRLFHALSDIKDSQKGRDVLVQIWLPTKRGDRHFLTTCGQPYWFDPNSQSLANYRSVSTTYQFPADENSNEILGLPGRVFMGKVPEWTPDVRYFSNEEFPRVGQAQRFNVSGTIALPVFEQDSRSCIGVIEVVLTTQRINYKSDLENICNALQAVELRGSDVVSVPLVKLSDNSYQAALPEICEVLKAVCDTHGLPLAQTWIPCIQQGKQGTRHSNENYKECVSTVDTACYVNDSSMMGFHEACSEHHLFKGQGVAGKAFTTNQPCFSPDITSFTKTEYPLSHHAKLFRLKAAVAIRLRSVHTRNADFVLEFFLPVNCNGNEEQREMLNSLSITIQQVCRSLRVVTSKELDEEAMLGVDESFPSDFLFDETLSEGVRRPYGENILSEAVPSWTASFMGVQEDSLTQGFEKQEKLTTATSPEDNDQKDSILNDQNRHRFGKATEKRRVKAEKTVSLEVLRKYFAGSLKDAAKSIGVCPTTLKRICRQHGITRWPSRKIKKVGHSLKKLQGVIDSVQGAEGTFQFSSVYENFTKASSPNKDLSVSYNISKINPTNCPESFQTLQQQECRFSPHTSASHSHSTSTCSQSSSSSLGCPIKKEDSVEENRTVKIERQKSQVALHTSDQELPRPLVKSRSHMELTDPFSLGNPFQLLKRRPEVFKVKAIYGEEKVRFRLQPTWGFQELKQETMKRFNIGDMCPVDLKYLDDDSEWVLLTCDADLEECVDVYKSSSIDTIKISVHRIALSASGASF